VYRVRLPGGAAVALKAVDFSGHDLGSCVREFGARRGCYRLAAHKLLKEMVLLERLRQPNVLQVRGWDAGVSGLAGSIQAPSSLEEYSLVLKKWASMTVPKLLWMQNPDYGTTHCTTLPLTPG
jgi:hypothetical protein